MLLMVAELLSPTPIRTARAVTAFSVQPVFPPQQEPGISAYYQVRTKPGEKIVLQAVITNDEDHDIEVELGAHTAYTNQSGSIVYTGGGEAAHPSLATAFADIASAQAKSVRVPARASITVSFEVAMPEQPYDGIVLGGLTFREPLPRESTPGIKNILQYVLAVVLSQGDGDVPTRLSVEPARVYQGDNGPVLAIALVNETAAILRPVDIQVRVSDRNGKELLQKTFAGWALAPNGSAILEVPVAVGLLSEPGCVLSIEAILHTEEGGHSFLFHQTLCSDV